MQVRPAEHEMLVEPNTVYLLPPQKEMIIRQRRLLLNDRDPRHGLTLPIDLFFRSLAQDAGERSIAVILSGSGSDGSRGVQEISKAGGTVFCESPDTAQFNGMPLSAMRTGTVDQVLPPGGNRCRGRGGRPSGSGSGHARARRLERRTRRRCHPAAAARGVCDRLLALQGRHGHAADRTASCDESVGRHRHVCRAAPARSARAQLALRRPPHRRHAILPGR